MGTKIHASLKSLLFRKALKLSPAASSGTSMGNLITLITKDINTIELSLWLLKDLIIFLMQFSTVIFLLYQKLGHSAAVGLGLMFLAVPLQGKLSSIFNRTAGMYANVIVVYIE